MQYLVILSGEFTWLYYLGSLPGYITWGVNLVYLISLPDKFTWGVYLGSLPGEFTWLVLPEASCF